MYTLENAHRAYALIPVVIHIAPMSNVVYAHNVLGLYLPLGSTHRNHCDRYGGCKSHTSPQTLHHCLVLIRRTPNDAPINSGLDNDDVCEGVSESVQMLWPPLPTSRLQCGSLFKTLVTHMCSEGIIIYSHQLSFNSHTLIIQVYKVLAKY